MKGHEKIIQMRMEKKKPAFVFINDYPCETDWFETGMHANVCTAGDSIERLDLRFLVDVAVSVSSEEENRAKALFEACKRANVSMVAATHTKAGQRPFDPVGWAAVWKRGA